MNRCALRGPWTALLAAAALAALPGCRRQPPEVLGTLEWDRITLPAPVAERIVAIDVREGQQVAAGARLLQLEPDRTQAQLQALQAQRRQSEQSLRELQAGPRQEQIAQARAQLQAAQAQARDASAYFARLQPLGRRQLVAAAEVDRASAAAGNAQAQVDTARQALLELQHGTRAEQLAQGAAALQAADAQVEAQALTLDKLDVVAPRAGRVDDLPYKLGDQAPVGSALAILLVGEAPYARVYVPEPMRAGVQVGDRVEVRVDGRAAAYAGRVRKIRSEPAFTPYYALSGADAARLSYVAEIALGRDAADLPAGLPVQAVLRGAGRGD